MKNCSYPLLGLFALGLSTIANAQDDVTAILGSLEPTANALTAGLEGTLNTLASTQSNVDASATLGDTLANTDSVLAGVEPGLALGNADIQQNVNALALTNLENLVDLSGIEATLKTFDPNNPDHIVGLPFALPGLLLTTIEPTTRRRVGPLAGPLIGVLNDEVVEPLVGSKLCVITGECFVGPDPDPPPPGALEPLINPVIDIINDPIPD